LPQRHRTSKADLLNLQEEKEIKKFYHRSNSLDEHYLRENRSITEDSSLPQRPWHCQLCATLNKTDSQLCSNCGSNKINVYIPIMHHLDKIKTKFHLQTNSPTRDK